MYGDDGWCRSCGTPLRSQCGPLTLRRTGLTSVAGGFVPNWRFDTVCLEGSLAEMVSSAFRVELREVAWTGASPGAVKQIVIPTVGSRWFDQTRLREATSARHGDAGAECPRCGQWRWMPMIFGLLPPVVADVLTVDADAIASPEWFGDGCQSFRQVLLRRELAELIAAASIKDFEVRSVT